MLAYKTSGVFNLAFGAQAYVSAVVYFKTHTEWGWGIVPSLLVSVVLLAPALGVALEWLIFRHLRTAPAVAKLVVTIGLTVALPAIVELVMNFQSVAGVTPEGIAPDGASVFYDPFGVYSFSRNELVAMVVAVAAMAALGVLFRYSAIGLRMRAVVESPRMTELNGIGADRVSAFAWALSSLFAGMAGVLIAPRFNTLAAGEFFNLVVVAVTAAAIGRLVSLPRALLGGIGLGVLISLINTFLPRWSADREWLQPLQDNLTPALPFVVLFAILIFVPSLRRTRESADPLAGVDPPPSLGGAVTAGRRLLVTRLLGTAAVVAVGVVVFTRADASWLFLVTQAVVLSVIYLSITVITGFAGQISLCQGTFAAIGAFAVFQLVDRYDMSAIVAALVGAGIAACIGAALSLPIRRLSGVWVAIATLAFAFFFDAVMVRLSWVGGGRHLQRHAGAAARDRSVGLRQRQGVPGPHAGRARDRRGGGRPAPDRNGGPHPAGAARQRGGGPVDRHLAGPRPHAAFAVSAFIAGLGGALLAMLQENVNYGNNFSPFAALFWIVLVVTLGARTVEGAVAAGATFSLFDPVILKGTFIGWILRSPDRIPDFFPLSPKWRFILFGLGAIQFARHPEGIIEARKRRSADRAARRAAARAERSAPAVEPATEAESVQAGEPVA